MHHDRGHEAQHVRLMAEDFHEHITPVSSTNSKRCCLISSASNPPLKCGMSLFGHYAKNPTIRPGTTIALVKDPDGNSVAFVERGEGQPRSQDPSVVSSGTSSPPTTARGFCR